MTVTINPMHAGHGVEYLLRTVAVADGDRSLRDPLTRYYTEQGTPLGYWLGSGIAGLDSELKVGDEVMTTSGIYGTISYLEDNIAHLVVDTDVVIRVSKTSVNRLGGAAASSDEVIDLDEVAGETDAGGDDAPSSKSKKS